MNRISILDCTLRDGGYVNDFNFGENTIKSIVKELAAASIDIIECGFMKSGAFDKDRSLFGSIDVLKDVIGKKNPNLMYVAMIQYGAITNEEIGEYDPKSIDGIRVTFHEYEIDLAFDLAMQLTKKGYKVFMQPVGTATYTDDALLRLIEKVNELRPFAFYLVDTLGTMYKNDLLRMFYLVDHNLNKNIVLGFHSHNNLQLAFANAQELMQLNTPRRMIIDSSIYGMGRGAGNLNTELVTQYINTNFELRYDNIVILEIIDKYIRLLSTQYRWGYDAAYYIASVTGCHPNYASFLLNKQTLHVQDIHAILNNLDMGKRALFDEQYIDAIYLEYLNHHVDDQTNLARIRDIISDKSVLILAPGRSLRINAAKINALASSGEYFVLSINFIPKDIHVDMMFISNMKRFKDMYEMRNSLSEQIPIVITSNITTESKKNILVVDFSSYTNEEPCIVDNAGLMCINLLKRIGVASVKLAGFDGFSSKLEENFYEPSLYLDVEAEQLMKMNEAMAKKLVQLSSQMDITFFTDSVYQRSR